MMEFEDEGPLHVKTEEDTAVDFLIGVLSSNYKLNTKNSTLLLMKASAPH